MAGTDSDSNNKLVLYDTGTDAETDLLGNNNIEVYHVNYLNSSSHQIVMFDGLRFIDNEYVLCQVDLTNGNTLTCSKTGTNELTDFQLFDNTDTIAGGGTNDTKTYLVGGTVTGLYGTLVLENTENDDTRTLTESGSFNFPIAVASDYNVTVQTQPDGQTCIVSNGSGTVSDAHVTSVSIACSTDAGVIVTVAGGGSESPEDGVLATSVRLIGLSPSDVAFDASGNFYIAGCFDYRIRKVDTNGIITTVAGTGTSGFLGDGGIATNAKLNCPGGITIDSSGSLYISDTNNYRIRKVDTNGIITTVAGTGTSGFSGDGGAATDAQLSSPQGIAFDTSGNLYISDISNDRIRKVDTNGIITTVAGGGAENPGDGGAATDAQLDDPYRIAFDTSGNLYISDRGRGRIRKVDTNGIITTVAGTGTSGFSGDGGAATDAQLSSPQGIAFDTSGNLYISDTTNRRIRKVDTNGIITTVAGTGTSGFSGDGDLATTAEFSNLVGIAVNSSGNLFIADYGNYRIRMVGGE